MRTRRKRLTTFGLAIAILVVVLMPLMGSRPEGLAVSHAQSCGGTIRSGRTVYGKISRAGRDCRYTFRGNTGDVVTIKMTKRSSSLDPYLSLLDPTGSVVASDDDSAGGGNSLINYTLRRSGTYTIVAGSYGGRSYGDFVLSLSVGGSTTSCGGTISSGQRVDGEISRAGRDCRYTFRGSAGDVVTIKMTKRSSSLDPWLDLLDPSGRIDAYDDDGGGGGNSLIRNHKLRRSGTYTIVARSYQNRSAGRFELELTIR